LEIPSLTLMENAARAVVSALAEHMESCLEETTAVVCGKGNNGGDGLAVARLLSGEGRRVKVFLAASAGTLSPDASIQLERLKSAGVEPEDISSEGGAARLEQALARCSLVVDALLGTGTKGAVRGSLSGLIDVLNRAPARVAAVDIPSGLSGNAYVPQGPAVRADLTVTLGFGKPVLFTPEGAAYCGEVLVKDIGIPTAAASGTLPAAAALDRNWARRFFKPRRPGAHKGSQGKVLLVAGSVGKSGAAVLAARAALRAGAGLVTVAVPEPALSMTAQVLPESMTLPLPATTEGTASMYALSPVLDFSKEVDAVGLGPGLGRVPETAALARQLYAELPVPTVVDADALNALSEEPDCAAGHAAPRVLTPHPGELGRLVGATPSEVLETRYALAPDRALAWEAVLLLKGYRTLVCAPDRPWRINLSGGAHMAAPGMGDALTGVIAALLARGEQAFEAASLGAWWHGAAADEAFLRLGGYGLLASEVADALPLVEGKLRSEQALEAS
ncbi:MAG: NAD(P)H-hydrate dehydratase, partial [Acidobacteriota bacterium]